MRARTGAAALLAVLVVTGVAGCYPAFPQTQFAYDPTDGVNTRVGDLRVINALVITEDGEDGNFVASAVNSGDEDIDLVLQYESDGEKTSVTVEVPARSTTDLGFGAEGQVFLPGIGTAPGTLLAVYLQYGDEPGKQFLVPVLDAALAQYDGLLPTAPPTPTPTPDPTITEEPAS